MPGLSPTQTSQYRGCLLGLAVGDCVGAAVEFEARDTFPPLTDMIGGGPFNLPIGHWTDDTSMALCMAASLIEKRKFDALDQMQRYVRWYRHGYMSSMGRCFDIGTATRQSLLRFERDGDPFSGSTDPWAAGNGSIMRLCPAVMYAWTNLGLLIESAAASSRTTHASPECIEACTLMAYFLGNVFGGYTRDEIPTHLGCHSYCCKNIAAIDRGEYLSKTRDEVAGSGYVVASLEAALWCFAKTDNYRDCILLAANLGDDTDTTAAVAGQIAGAYYGEEGIPDDWLAKLHRRDEIVAMADGLFELSEISFGRS